MTTRLYYQDAYIKEFDATVTSCLPDKNGYWITLDQTAFYPEGGGQPCDLGILTYRKNTIAVTDTQESDGSLSAPGEILHFCTQEIPAGTAVQGKLDWQRRITNMREHSGEHILSGIICSSYNVNNVGFHMGKDAVTIDFDGMLTPEQIAAAQQKANLKIMENVPVLVEYPDSQTLSEMYYRSKKELEGDVRIVTIPGADVCACCGTHVRTTGEVGPVCVTGTEHFKKGVRLTILIGEKALADYAQKTENIRKISTLLSAKPEQAADSVDRLQNAYTQLKTEYTGLRLEILEKKVEAIPADTPVIVLFEQALSPMELRRLADKLQAKAGFAAVFTGDDTEGYKYVICAAKMDIAAFGKAFNTALNGRGGGRPPMIQGSLTCTRARIEAYLSKTLPASF